MLADATDDPFSHAEAYRAAGWTLCVSCHKRFALAYLATRKVTL